MITLFLDQTKLPRQYYLGVGCRGNAIHGEGVIPYRLKSLIGWSHRLKPYRLKSLNPHKAAGPDKMNPLLLRELADIIAPVITRLFRASLKQVTTPKAWKEAHVTPVFKKGEKYMPVNYRPVSLTSILCKQMEHILSSQIMRHLNKNKLLYNKQHGFRSKVSCETQFIEYTSDVLKIVQDRK